MQPISPRESNPVVKNKSPVTAAEANNAANLIKTERTIEKVSTFLNTVTFYLYAAGAALGASTCIFAAVVATPELMLLGAILTLVSIGALFFSSRLDSRKEKEPAPVEPRHKATLADVTFTEEQRKNAKPASWAGGVKAENASPRHQMEYVPLTAEERANARPVKLTMKGQGF